MSDEYIYSEKDIKFLKKSINLWWVFGVLTTLFVLAVACFIVFWFCEIEYCKILNIFAIVSTLLAIILSIFSILYSYTTSQDVSKALSSVTAEVMKIEKTHSSIEKHLSDMFINGGRPLKESDFKKNEEPIQKTDQEPSNKVFAFMSK